MSTETGPTPFRLLQRRTFEDPTPNAFILHRIIRPFVPDYLKFVDYTEEQKAQIFQHLTRLGLKLLSVWIHKKRYLDLVAQLSQEANAAPVDPGTQPHLSLTNSQELWMEFDEFLVQSKSTLDYLVKFPQVQFGEKGWNLPTFGNHGAQVIRAFRQNSPGWFRPFATAICEGIERRQQWLDALIEARDRLNHFQRGGIDPDFFVVFALKEKEKIMVRVPQWSEEQTVGDFMETSFFNLFHFAEDFIGCMYFSKIHRELSAFHGPFTNPIEAKSTWSVTTYEEMMRHVEGNDAWTYVTPLRREDRRPK